MDHNSSLSILCHFLFSCHLLWITFQHGFLIGEGPFSKPHPLPLIHSASTADFISSGWCYHQSLSLESFASLPLTWHFIGTSAKEIKENCCLQAQNWHWVLNSQRFLYKRPNGLHMWKVLLSGHSHRFNKSSKPLSQQPFIVSLWQKNNEFQLLWLVQWL